MVLKSIKSVIGLVIVLLMSFGINLALPGQSAYAVGEDISTSFTDPNFKQAVWEWLGNSGGQISFTQQDLIDWAVTNKTLDVSNRNITSLAGLGYFDETTLEKLNCSSNQLTYLPALPGNLIKLDCSINRITSLREPLPGNLVELYCNNNRLTNLPALPGTLQYFDCNANYLNVFSGDLKGRIDALTSIKSMYLVPQYKVIGVGGPLTIAQGQSQQLESSYFKQQWTENGTDWTDVPGTISLPDFEFTCSDYTIADVNSNGLITAEGQGNCEIKALFADEDSEYTKVVIPVTVIKPVTGVKLNKLALSLAVGRTEALTATVEPADATNKAVTWKSDNENVATVDSNGLVTAVAEGTANIEVSSQENPQIKDTCAVTVFPDISVNFTDPNFKQAVWEWLGNSGDPGPFTKQDLINRLATKNYTLNVSKKSIASLVGIENFNGTTLKTFDCSYNQLTGLPNMPGGLTSLTCTDNTLTTLPALPDSLVALVVSRNQLSSLPDTLPSKLNHLHCASNKLQHLPDNLPGLKTLSCGQNKIASLPTLPTSLTLLECAENQLIALPDPLPPTLTTLTCVHNQLTALPNLPGTLTELYCSLNCITSLPDPLPGNLVKLYCNNNRLTSLPALPGTLEYFYCYTNYLDVFSGDLQSRIDALTNIKFKSIAPQYKVIGVGGPLTITQGQSQQLGSSYFKQQSTQNGTDWTNVSDVIDFKGFDFSSSNKNVADVDSNGLITAFGAGSCNIYADYTKANSTYTRVVIPVTVPGKPVTGVNLNKHDLTLTAGQTETLTATVEPTDATNKALTWKSDNENVATVDSNGLVTAVAEGTANIEVSSEENPQIKDTCAVTVNASIKPVTEINLNKHALTLTAGQTETLTATIKPTDATNKAVIWKSDNKNVATVDNNGQVTAVGAGTANIEVSSQENPQIKDTCAVTVNATDGADLAVEIISCPDQCAAGSKVNVEVEVTNVGKATSGKAAINFYINGKLCLTKAVSKLKTDGNKPKVIKGKITIPRDSDTTTLIKVEVVTDHPDTNQNNNSVQKDITVVFPDLTITSVSPKKELVGGKSGTLNVGIENLTVAPAGQFIVRVYQGNETLGEKKVSSLKKGSKNLSIKIKVPTGYSSSTVTLKAVIDATGLVKEEKEDNNEKSYPPVG